MNLLCQMIDPKLATVLLSDFGATMRLQAKDTDNCVVDGHAIIDVWYHLTNHRLVNYVNETGEMDTHKLVDCHVTQYIGATRSKGKSHNWIFHGRAFMDQIMQNEETREKQYDANDDELVFTYFMITDGSPYQYWCQFNIFNQIRICCEKCPNKIRVVHLVAAKYGFKGAWDADGGRSKAKLKKLEDINIRSPRSSTAFENLAKHMTKTKCNMPIDSWIESRDKRIIRKTPFTMDSRTYKYIADTQDKYNELVQKFADDRSIHILYLDREEEKKFGDPGARSLHGSKSHYQFSGPTEHCAEGTETDAPQYRVTMTKRVCACIPCRNGNNLDVLCLHIDDVGPQEMRLLQCTEYYQWPPPQPNPGQNVGGG